MYIIRVLVAGLNLETGNTNTDGFHGLFDNWEFEEFTKALKTVLNDNLFQSLREHEEYNRAFYDQFKMGLARFLMDLATMVENQPLFLNDE